MIWLVLVVVGLVLGSFVNALVWRLKSGKDWLKGRSECVHCHHQLTAKDLIPVVSWLSLKGECRYCHKPISVQYPLVELLTAGLFVFSYYFWPVALQGVGLFTFIVWLFMLVGFMALVVFDLRWFELPNAIIYPLIGLALAEVIVVAVWNHQATGLLGAFWGVFIMSGLFYLFFQLSRGKWMGGGDVKLSVVLGLLVGGPLMSILLLFLASCAGTLSSVPFVIRGQLKAKAPIPFGPFLILAVIIVQLFGASIIAWYKGWYF